MPCVTDMYLRDMTNSIRFALECESSECLLFLFLIEKNLIHSQKSY